MFEVVGGDSGADGFPACYVYGVGKVDLFGFFLFTVIELHDRLLVEGDEVEEGMLAFADKGEAVVERLRLDVEALGIVGPRLFIKVNSGDHLLRIEVREELEGLGIEADAEIGTCELVSAVLIESNEEVFLGKASEELAIAVFIEATDLGIEENLWRGEGRDAFFLELDALHGILGDLIAGRAAALDLNICEGETELLFARGSGGVEVHSDHFGLGIRIGSEPEDLAGGVTLSEVVLLIARDAGDVETLDHSDARLAVGVDHVVGSALIILLKDVEVDDILTYKGFIGNLGDDHPAVLAEDNDEVEVGAIESEFILLETGANEALLSVVIKLGIGNGDCGSLNGLEGADLRLALAALAVLLQEILVVPDGIISEVLDIVRHLLHSLLYSLDMLVGLEGIELRDALNADLGELNDVFLRDLAAE